MLAVQSPLQKIISLHPSGKSSLQIRSHPTPPEGRIALVTDAGRDAVDAAAFLRAMGLQGESKGL